SVAVLAVAGVRFQFVFFFQAEDGIRDRNVTGVQTCALPIYWFPHTRSALTKTNTRVVAGGAGPGPLATAERRNRVLNLFDKEVVENGALRLAVELGAKWPALVPTINRIAQSAVSDRTYRASAHEVFVTP